MLGYVYGHNEIVADFVAKLTPHCRRGFSNCQTIGVIDHALNGRLIAGLVYHNYDPEAGIIEISGAAFSDRQWLTRETIKRMYQYPFFGCGVQMVVQRTPADDEVLLAMLAKYDYTFIRMPRLFGPARDGVICCLTYEAWCNNRFNKRFKHHILPPVEHEEAA